jgi:hypothetical protein
LLPERRLGAAPLTRPPAPQQDVPLTSRSDFALVQLSDVGALRFAQTGEDHVSRADRPAVV